MSEVWKSTPRKYCDFCKCWIADNKISVSIHENGKGHKLAVQKKITSSHKASVKKEKEEIQAQKLFRIMEKNAKEAYKRDVGLGSDSKVQNGSLSSDSSSGSGSMRNQKRKSESKFSNPDNSAKQLKIEESVEDVDEEPEWYEFKTNSGQLYYIHVKTNESTWVKPESSNILKVYDNVAVSETKSEPEPKPSSAFRDISATHGYRSKEELEYAEMKTEPREGAKGRETAYGAFVPVENNDDAPHPIKLDLPEQTDNSHLFSHLPREAFEEVDPDDRLKITEKRIEYDDDDVDDGVKKEPASSSGLFKKRKFGSNKNRNLKQRDGES